MSAVSDSEPAIVISGRRDDWPDGARTLTPRKSSREPNGTLWFGAELDVSRDQVWFRIEAEAVRRIPEKTPAARSRRLVDALLARARTSDLPLKRGISRFEVRVSDTAEVWIERLRW